ncbi:[LysW]-aminoadipate/[LysW]-glutamate kinase [Acidianus sulfidivorans JP7]|uniref:[LysW]-aminoadipate/[LysW]-glutamate kinase n=1 Tax=Acidianus sulfidivorans JP7 TaxID=619593 RepID=A0A2U9IMS8_9CREN|nr:[LysW]-aminoadipate/[LysW]-glutamate kinase [Acidianus sulfidivorans]AWR97369.1 [LysW]-aminoadipate/[LysW]-glutamate kinase [Acidianus sulfidivorans JP7]
MIVVKAGGRVIKNALENVISSILQYQGKLFFVHGGGDIVSEYSRKFGIEPIFVTSPEGIKSRYTSKEELEVYIMVMSLISKNIVNNLVKSGKKALSISGVDEAIVKAERKKKIIIIDERGKKRIIDGGYTGKITSVSSEFLIRLLDFNDYVIISPIAVDTEEGTMLNVDGDQMAFNIAKATKAEALVLLTDVKGVIYDNSVVSRLTLEEAKELSKKVGAGMNRKLLMAANAIESGVGKVIIASGYESDCINNALKGNGTVISNE